MYADALKMATLIIATSPAAFNSLEAAPLRIISSPRDQQSCAACTAFTVATAAEVRAHARAAHRGEGRPDKLEDNPHKG